MEQAKVYDGRKILDVRIYFELPEDTDLESLTLRQAMELFYKYLKISKPNHLAPKIPTDNINDWDSFKATLETGRKTSWSGQTFYAVPAKDEWIRFDLADYNAKRYNTKQKTNQHVPFEKE